MWDYPTLWVTSDNNELLHWRKEEDNTRWICMIYHQTKHIFNQTNKIGERQISKPRQVDV